MLIARQVFQAKYGAGDALVALFREFNANLQKSENWPPLRILTDASGQFFTVVTEIEVESFAAWEKSFKEVMAQPWMADLFQRMVPLVDSGRREFYTIVE